jgi:hypothetical protein
MKQLIANTPSTGIPALRSSRALAHACATPTTDSRTLRVRGDVRPAAAGVAVSAQRIRVTAATTGMGQLGFAGYVPGSLAWSPPN